MFGTSYLLLSTALASEPEAQRQEAVRRGRLGRSGAAESGQSPAVSAGGSQPGRPAG